MLLAVSAVAVRRYGAAYLEDPDHQDWKGPLCSYLVGTAGDPGDRAALEGLPLRGAQP